MNSFAALPRIVAAVMVFLWPAVAPQNQDKASSTTAAQKEPVPTPGPEMEQLKFLRGYWRYVSTYDKTTFYPNGGKGSGTYITTGDPEEHVYKSYVFGNNFPGCIVRTGHWDGTTLIFDADFVLAGAKLHLQSSTVENSDGTVTIVEKFGVDGGELKPTLTLKATREKI